MTVSNTTNPFRFKQFTILQERCKMKVGTDGVLLGAWANTDGTRKMLDVGAGSGLIALMLAQRRAEARIVGVEIDRDSFEEACANIANSPWSDRLELRHEAVQVHANSNAEAYDLIVSNPPFFSGGVMPMNMDRSQVRHTVKLSHGDLLRSARQMLKGHGRIALVLPYIEGLRMVELARSYHLYPHRLTEVRSREHKPIERLLLELGKRETDLKRDHLVLHDDSHETGWSEAFRRLTGDFYLNL